MIARVCVAVGSAWYGAMLLTMGVTLAAGLLQAGVLAGILSALGAAVAVSALAVIQGGRAFTSFMTVIVAIGGFAAAGAGMLFAVAAFTAGDDTALGYSITGVAGTLWLGARGLRSIGHGQ